MAVVLTESPYSDKLQHDMCQAVKFDAVFINEKASLPDFADVVLSTFRTALTRCGTIRVR